MVEKKRKICFVISNIKVGGAENQFVKLMNNLNHDYFDIYLLIYSYNGSIAFDINPNINIIKNNEINRIKNKIMKIIYSLFFLRSFFKQNYFDIIQTTLFNNSFILRLAIPKLYYNKVIASIRTTSYKWWQYFFEYYFIKKSLLVTNSKFVFKKLSKYKSFSKKLFYIPNGFEVKNYNYKKFNTDKIKLGTVGRISHEKNQLEILNVLTKLKNQNIMFFIYGDKGNAYSSIKSFVEKNNINNMVKIIIGENDPKKLYEKIDIFVLPSLYEGFPNSIFEAMLNSKICIISDKANKDNHIIDKVNGFVFESGNISNLIENINYLIERINSEEINKIRETAFRKVREQYSIEKIITDYNQIYMLI
ncbi:MAG: glycosyltransferase family 4 protein [Candidatus Marinimicrobia bacterium]|nr:glycosyltransferase family 4 protein [Candidatus Neomarinimicrobiota bacterium]